MHNKEFQTISPIDNDVVCTTTYSSESELNACLRFNPAWQSSSLDERIQYLKTFLELFADDVDDIAKGITLQMGRPFLQAKGEAKGVLERANYLLSIAKDTLADHYVSDDNFIRRYPLGKILVIAPWNYPYLTAINAIIPALLAGNHVILKHASQTPLCALKLQDLFDKAGLPQHVFSHVFLTHEATSKLIQHQAIQFVSFTGSVKGGYAIQNALSKRFIGRTLELGGKDPAIVLQDCQMEETVAGLVDGAFFNSGQSCCGIERIYVAKECFDTFVEAFQAKTCEYQLGHPLAKDTTLGPMVNHLSAEFVRQQTKEALSLGAKALVDESQFANSQVNTPYLAPQVLVNVNHQMSIMKEESFGPIVGIMPFSDIDEAIHLANDSPYGLTASVWTENKKRMLDVADKLHTGTVFFNRCDYLNPALAWTGVKETGIGISLSHLGFHALTRVKSFNMGK